MEDYSFRKIVKPEILKKCNLLCAGLKVIKTHQIERTLRIAKELSDLIVYCRPVSTDTEKG